MNIKEVLAELKNLFQPPTIKSDNYLAAHPRSHLILFAVFIFIPLNAHLVKLRKRKQKQQKSDKQTVEAV